MDALTPLPLDAHRARMRREIARNGAARRTVRRIAVRCALCGAPDAGDRLDPFRRRGTRTEFACPRCTRSADPHGHG